MGSAAIYRRLLRTNHAFRRLYLARLVSFAGDWFLTVPLLGLVYDLSGSTLATSLVLAAQSIPTFVFSPLAGAVVDRFDRKRIMVITDCLRAVSLLGLLFVDRVGGLWLALTIAALGGVGAAFFFPASTSAVPNLVAREELAPANVLIGSAWGSMAALGAALGGIFSAAVGRQAAFMIDAATFAVAAVLIAGIRVPMSEGKAEGRVHVLAATRQALGYARRHPAVAALLTSKGGFALYASGGVALFPIISLAVFDAGDAGTGLLFGARGLGALVGPFVAFRLLGGSSRRILGSIGAMMALWGFGYLLLAAAPSIGLAALALVLAHAGGGTQWSFSTYGLQDLTSDEVRGRIFSFDFGLVTLTMGISFVIAGVIAEWVAVRTFLAVIAGVGIAFGFVWGRATRRFWDSVQRGSPEPTDEPAS